MAVDVPVNASKHTQAIHEEIVWLLHIRQLVLKKIVQRSLGYRLPQPKYSTVHTNLPILQVVLIHKNPCLALYCLRSR